jgi:hypothetical protein
VVSERAQAKTFNMLKPTGVVLRGLRDRSFTDINHPIYKSGLISNRALHGVKNSKFRVSKLKIQNSAQSAGDIRGVSVENSIR